MRQPVMDTLRLSQKLRETGVESGQAEGMARALGTELDEHVAVRKDLDAGFDRMGSEIALARSNLEGQIDGVRSEINLTRSNLEGQIDGVRSEINLTRSNLESQIDGVRSEINLTRSNLEGQIDGVRSEINLTRSELEGQIDGVRSEINLTRSKLEAQFNLMRSEFNTKFNWGFGLMLAFLSVLVGLGVLDYNKPTPAPAITYVPLVAPATLPQPAPNAAVPALPGATSPDAASPPTTPR